MPNVIVLPLFDSDDGKWKFRRNEINVMTMKLVGQWRTDRRMYGIHRVAPKNKPLPNDQKIVLKLVNEIRCIVKLKRELSTIILFVDISYSMRDVHSDLNNYALPSPSPPFDNI